MTGRLTLRSASMWRTGENTNIGSDMDMGD